MIEELPQQLDLPDYAPPPVQEFRQLDPRVVGLWRVTDLISFGVLLLALLMSLSFVIFANLRFWPWLLGAWFALAPLCVWYSFWHPPRYYRSWSYRIDDRVLETRSGLMFKRAQLLPLSRLQHVDIERGPFERMYGLASLVLHTAGTHSASIRIPGLEADEAVRLRDHLVEIGGDDAV